MSAILNFLNAHYNFLVFQPILMTLVSKSMDYSALSDKTYLSLGLWCPLNQLYISPKELSKSKISNDKEFGHSKPMPCHH